MNGLNAIGFLMWCNYVAPAEEGAFSHNNFLYDTMLPDVTSRENKLFYILKSVQSGVTR